MLLTEHFPPAVLLVLHFDQKHVNWKLTLVTELSALLFYLVCDKQSNRVQLVVLKG